MAEQGTVGSVRAGAHGGLVLGAFVAWLGAALTLALSGGLQTPPGAPRLRVLAAAGAPILAFVAWYRVSPAFRVWILGLDLRLVVMFQAWRVIGGIFLVLLAFGLLPGIFAWPAGLGDIAVGVTAPLVARALWRRPDIAFGRGFRAWKHSGLSISRLPWPPARSPSASCRDWSRAPPAPP